MSLLNRLRHELNSLRAERELALLANDFAMTDGTIRTFNREIARIQSLIAEQEGALAQAA